MDYFTLNPLKINILDKLLTIKKSYIILGDISDDVYYSIINKDEKKIKEFYGDNWKQLLHMESKVEGGSNKELIDEDEELVFDDLDLQEIQFDSLKFSEPTNKSKNLKIKESKNSNIEYVRNILFYSTDTLQVVKEKIFLITGEQPYNQHIVNIKLYEHYINNNIYENYYEYEKYIHNVPYDNYFYNNHSNLSIKVYDYCKKLNNRKTIDIIPLSEMVNMNDLNTIIQDDKKTVNIIYWSCIYKYYPMINHDSFISLVIKDDKNISIAHLDKFEISVKYKQINKIYKSIYNIDNNELNLFVSKNYIETVNRIISNVVINLDTNRKINLKDIFNSIEIIKIKNLQRINLFTSADNGNLNMYKINKFIEVDKKNITYAINEIVFIYKYYTLQVDIYGNYTFNLSLNKYIAKNKIDEYIHTKLNKVLARLNMNHVKREYIRITNMDVDIEYKTPFSNIQFSKIENYIQMYINGGILILDKNELNNLYFSINILSNTTYEDKYLNETIKSNKYYIFYMLNNLLHIKIANTDYYEIEYAKLFLYKILFSIKDKLEIFNNVDYSNLSLNKIDPVLFGYKKSTHTYRRVCQKPYQPKAYNPNLISSTEKKKYVKYKNITTGEDIYYQCPNEFPFLKFIKNYHPNGYCLPCCVSKQPDFYKNYHNISKPCFETNKYPTDIDTNEEEDKVDSSYIIKYSSNLHVNINRVIDLPPQLYLVNNYNGNVNYFLKSIQQMPQNSISYILADVLNMEYKELIQNIIQVMKSTPLLFHSLLNIENIEYFNTCEEFIEILIKSLLEIDNSEINWDSIFLNLSKMYNIEFIELTDSNGVININNSSIEDDNKKYVVVIKNNNTYYPIYEYATRINKRVIGSENLINTYYSIDSYIIVFLKSIITKYREINYKKNVLKPITINEINLFIKSDSKSKINKYYYNKQGLCYALSLKQNESVIIVPVLPVYKSDSKTFNTTLYQKQEYTDVISFIVKYNNFIYGNTDFNDARLKEYLREVNYSFTNGNKIINEYVIFGNYMRIKKYICFDSKVVGLIVNNLTWYIKPLPLNKMSIKEIDITNPKKLLTRVYHNNSIDSIELRYDPFDINTNIIKNSLFYKKDEYYANLYNTHIYKLFVLQFIYYYQNEPNTKLRYVLEHTFSFDEIKQFLITTYNLDSTAERYIDSVVNDIMNEYKQINNAVKSDNIYRFDKVLIELFDYMDKETIYNELNNVIKKIVVEKNVNVYSEILKPCINVSKDNLYCEGSKLIIPVDTSDMFLNLFINDIKNPFKKKVLVNNIVNSMPNKYIAYPNERIYMNM